MPELKTVAVTLEVTPVERQWLHVAVGNQINMIRRSRSKEMFGSEIHNLRGRELEQLEVIRRKVSP